MTAPETYRRHAQPLSEAEQALWNRPAAPESLVERVAAAICEEDDESWYVMLADEDPKVWDYRRFAAVALDVITGDVE